MRKTSLAHAKAHLSELVDAAEHRHARTLILRHGKPAAAIVPVDVAEPPLEPMSDADVDAMFEELASQGDPDFGAVTDLVRGRR